RLFATIKFADAPAGRGAIDDGALATGATRWKFGRSSWWLDRDRARSSVPRAPAPHSALPSPKPLFRRKNLGFSVRAAEQKLNGGARRGSFLVGHVSRKILTD